MKISRITHWRQHVTHPRLSSRLFPLPPPSLPMASSKKEEPKIVDFRDPQKFSPKLFFGYSVRYWLLWLLGALVIAVWLGPPLAEFTIRFLVKICR